MSWFGSWFDGWFGPLFGYGSSAPEVDALPKLVRVIRDAKAVEIDAAPIVLVARDTISVTIVEVTDG